MSVIGTEQRLLIKNAAMVDAITLLRREENVPGMEGGQCAVTKDAATLQRREGFALGTVQR